MLSTMKWSSSQLMEEQQNQQTFEKVDFKGSRWPADNLARETSQRVAAVLEIAVIWSKPWRHREWIAVRNSELNHKFFRELVCMQDT